LLVAFFKKHLSFEFQIDIVAKMIPVVVLALVASLVSMVASKGGDCLGMKQLLMLCEINFDLH
jgi:hypothetical protein